MFEESENIRSTETIRPLRTIIAVDPIREMCNCERDNSTIFCRACHKFFYGRVSIPCKKHPRVIYIFDHKQCVRCHASSYMLEPLPHIDYSRVKDDNNNKLNKI